MKTNITIAPRVKSVALRIPFNSIFWAAALALAISLGAFSHIANAESTDTGSAAQDQEETAFTPNIQIGNEDPFMGMSFDAWNPWAEMDRLHQHMNRLFDRSLNHMNQMRRKARMFHPDIDLVETPESYVAEVDLPGIDKEAIHVEITDDELIISGERGIEETVEKGNYYRSERSFGTFRRAVALPEPIVQEKVTAKYENGVLKIVLPKKEPKKEVKKAVQIAIQ